MKTSKLRKYALVIAGLTVLGGIICFRWYVSMQISTEKANKICSNFLDEVKADVTGVPGYAVVKGSKSCKPIEDEAGFQDYKLLVTLHIANGAMDSETAIKSSMKELSARMPRRNYPISIYNLPAQNGQAATLCLTSFRYIDNDGKDYPQGPPDHTYEYSVRGADKPSPCEDV